MFHSLALAAGGCPANSLLFDNNPAAFPNCVYRTYFTQSCPNNVCQCVPLGRIWTPYDSANVTVKFSDQCVVCVFVCVEGMARVN